MKSLKFISLFLLIYFVGCNEYQQLENEAIPTHEVGNHKRMAFNQDVYLLNSTNKSEIYKVGFDFQGLQGDATLTKLDLWTEDNQDFELPRGGHMCVSPDNRFLTVVIAKRSRIYLIDLNTYEVRSSLLLGYRYDQRQTSISTVRENPQAFYMSKIGGITQVDVDQEGFLFIAGKAGFFRVVSDRGNGMQDPSNINTGKDIWTEIWERDDPSLENNENWVHALQYKFNGNLSVESTEDGEEYFEDVTPFNPKKVKFRGGDILFTQNSNETDGFEHQRLISFSQWKGGTAIYLDLEWNWATQTIQFDAGKVMGGLNMNRNNESGKGTGRVTGAALTGDNMVFTSHHSSKFLQLRTLDGTVVRDDIELQLDGNEENLLIHNWGDMASTQQFDRNTNNPNDKTLSNKEIDGQYFEDWYKGEKEGHQYAEVKLYRPKRRIYEPNDLSQPDPEESYNATRDSRGNAANADLADYRKNAQKFVSLGGEGGYVLMQLQTPIKVNSYSTLQVVETSWNRAPQFTPTSSGFNSYAEKAKVFVLPNDDSRYYSDTDMQVDDPDWIEIGEAFIANNEFSLSETVSEGTTIKWIMIKDSGSETPDGFDLNFVSAYEFKPEVLITQDDHPWLPCDLTEDSFAIRTGDDNPSTKVRGGEAMFRIPQANEIIESSIIELTQEQKDFLGTKSGRSRVIGLFTAEIDGKLHAYEIHDDCSIKGIRHFEWGGENKNASFVPLPLNPNNYDLSQVTTAFKKWKGFDLVYTLNGETKKVPFANKQEARLRYKKAIDYTEPTWNSVIQKLSGCGEIGDKVNITTELCLTPTGGFARSTIEGSDVFQLRNPSDDDVTFIVTTNTQGTFEIFAPAKTWHFVKGGTGTVITNVKAYTDFGGTSQTEVWNKGGTSTLGSELNCPMQ
ncbi:hypothetical protein [Sediminitomix flava]|uniref:Uncharacterized protein n=1 Tax=Sediminitomix flava TaxID=379075 RepID=A0A315ZGD3_SEDFL|nr:hypothetical protein [Sediminitomix flava]PWJ44392.1 hypothetical protein BC781_101751 [Sediminitomix flava]